MHELEMVNGKASMFSVKETPWHRLGVVLDNPPNTATAIREANADWRVKLLPLVIADTNRRVEARAVVRVTDGKILSHHVGPDFTPLQNLDAFQWFDPFVASGEATLETAGVLHGGARVWIMARLTGSSAEIADGDTVRNYLLLSNAHGIGESVRIGMTPTRVVCANTLAMAHGNGRLLRVRHTSGIHQAMADVRGIIDTATQTFRATVEQWRKLASSRVVSRADLRRYVIRVLDLPEQEDGSLSTRCNNILAAVLENCVAGKGNGAAAVAGTWWAALNGVTEYLSYGRGRNEDTRLNALWFGEGANRNAKALETALEMAA